MKSKPIKLKTSFWKTVCPLLIGCLTLAVSPVMAQQGGQYGGQQQQKQQYDEQRQQGQQQYGQQPGQKDDFKDEDVEKFAKAHQQVRELQSEYSSELQKADDEDKAREVQNKYREKIISVIEDKDMSVEKYNEISMAMQGRAELREKIEDMM